MHSKYKYKSKMSGLSSHEREFINYFVASEKTVIGADDVISVRSMTRPAANQILRRLQQKGWLQRIKRGVYVVVPLGAAEPEPVIEATWPLAKALFSPCYISGWTAAEQWDLTEQIFNTISLVTSRPQRSRKQTLGGVEFYTKLIKPELFFGTRQLWFGSRNVAIADPHRLVIDILNDSELGGGGRHTIDVVREYWKSKHADSGQLLEYAIRFGRGAVFKRLGFTADRFGKVTAGWLEACQKKITSGISKLDPGSPTKGLIVTRWNLQINIPVESE